MAEDVFDEDEMPARKVDRGAVFAALTGRRGDVSGVVRVCGACWLRSRARRAGRGEVDTRAAAVALGVSQRTVQRWLRSERETGRAGIRSENLTRTQKASRQAATTRQGRRRALQDARTRRNRQRPVTVRVKGDQGPRNSGKGYVRNRTTGAELDPEQHDAMLDAYEAGGDRGVAEYTLKRCGVRTTSTTGGSPASMNCGWSDDRARERAAAGAGDGARA